MTIPNIDATTAAQSAAALSTTTQALEQGASSSVSSTQGVDVTQLATRIATHKGGGGHHHHHRHHHPGSSPSTDQSQPVTNPLDDGSSFDVYA